MDIVPIAHLVVVLGSDLLLLSQDSDLLHVASMVNLTAILSLPWRDAAGNECLPTTHPVRCAQRGS